METNQYTLSTWLLLPYHDAPAELFMAGMLTESDPMPEAAARRRFASMTWKEAMQGIEHENEPLCLSLDIPDADGFGISQQTRILTPAPPAAPEAAAALPAERLEQIRAVQGVWTEYAAQKPWRAASNTPHLATSYAGELLQEVDRLAAALAAAEARAEAAEDKLEREHNDAASLWNELTDFKDEMLAGLKEAYGQGDWLNIHHIIEDLKADG